MQQARNGRISRRQKQLSSIKRILVFLHVQHLLITSNVTGHHRGPKRKRWAGHRALSLQRTSYVAMCFHRRVWYRALSQRYACI